MRSVFVNGPERALVRHPMVSAIPILFVLVPSVASQSCSSRSVSLRGLFYKLEMDELNTTRTSNPQSRESDLAIESNHFCLFRSNGTVWFASQEGHPFCGDGIGFPLSPKFDHGLLRRSQFLKGNIVPNCFKNSTACNQFIHNYCALDTEPNPPPSAILVDQQLVTFNDYEYCFFWALATPTSNRFLAAYFSRRFAEFAYGVSVNSRPLSIS